MKSSMLAVLGFFFLLLDPAGALRSQKVIANATTVKKSKRGPLSVNSKVKDMITWVQKIWASTNSVCGLTAMGISKYLNPPGLRDDLQEKYDMWDNILSVATAVITLVLLWIPGPVKDEWAAVFSTIMDNSVRTALFSFYVINWFSYGKVYLGLIKGDENIEKNFKAFCESLDLKPDPAGGLFREVTIDEPFPTDSDSKKEIVQKVVIKPSQKELYETGKAYCDMAYLQTEDERKNFKQEDILNKKLRDAVDKLNASSYGGKPLSEAFDDPVSGLGSLGEFNLTQAVAEYNEAKMYTWGTLTPLVAKFCKSFTAFYNSIVALCLPCITGLPALVNKTGSKTGTIFSQSDVTEEDCKKECGIQCNAVSLTWKPGVCGSYNKAKRLEYWKTEAY